MSEKEIEKTLQMIVNELAGMKGQLADIQRQLAYLANPMAAVSVDEKMKALKAARATGDKRVIRETLKKINGR